tara:strand:+ start:2049 stop:2666 length:618 start_codon:yes stop_codon:yes gene_type:complete
MNQTKTEIKYSVMENINLKDYDINYELQYAELMIRVLKPYIIFMKPSEIFEDRTITIIRIDGEKKMTVKGFIYFMQCTFPRMVLDEISKTFNEMVKCDIKKEIFNTMDRKRDKGDNKRFIKPYLYSESEKEIYDKYIDEMNNYDKEKLKEVKEYFSKRQDSGYKMEYGELNERYNFLKEMNEICRNKNGTINSVKRFLDNLHYLL